MKFEKENLNNISILTLLDARLDAKLAVSFREKVADIIEKGEKNIVLDFSNISFIDSSGLGSIVSIFKLIGREGKLVLCGINSLVMGTFTRTKMEKVFVIKGNREDALKEF